MIKKMMERHRLEEYKAVCRWVYSADIEELAAVIEEIRCVHDNLLVFNEDIRSVDKVESVCINGECIQLNLEKEIKEENEKIQ